MASEQVEILGNTLRERCRDYDVCDYRVVYARRNQRGKLYIYRKKSIQSVAIILLFDVLFFSFNFFFVFNEYHNAELQLNEKHYFKVLFGFFF